MKCWPIYQKYQEPKLDSNSELSSRKSGAWVLSCPMLHHGRKAVWSWKNAPAQYWLCLAYINGSGKIACVTLSTWDHKNLPLVFKFSIPWMHIVQNSATVALRIKEPLDLWGMYRGRSRCKLQVYRLGRQSRQKGSDTEYVRQNLAVPCEASKSGWLQRNRLAVKHTNWYPHKSTRKMDA